MSHPVYLILPIAVMLYIGKGLLESFTLSPERYKNAKQARVFFTILFLVMVFDVCWVWRHL